MGRVIDIQRRYMELGRIRLGEKREYERNGKMVTSPAKLDTWRLTSASKALLDSAAAIYGGTVEEWRDAPDKGYYQLTTDTAVLDVMVPPGDPYSQFYELWSGGGCKRRCNGARELLSDSPCKCDPEERDCKITTRINVMLPQIAGLGVWRMESHGYYAAAELPDQLDLLQQISGGRIVAGLLRIEQRSSKKDGKTQRYPVPVLDLPNITLASLTGGQVIVNAPMPLEQGKPALLGTAELPAETEFDGNQPVGFGERPPLPNLGDDPRARLLAAARQHRQTPDMLERLADQVGVPEGDHATPEQIEQIIALIESQPIGAATQESEPDVVDGGSSDTTPPDEQPEVERAVAPSGVAPAADVPLASAAGALSIQDVLAVTGGTEVTDAPPRPGSDAYKELGAYEKSQARAYWHSKEWHSKEAPRGARETPEAAEVPMGL